MATASTPTPSMGYFIPQVTFSGAELTQVRIDGAPVATLVRMPGTFLSGTAGCGVKEACDEA